MYAKFSKVICFIQVFTAEVMYVFVMFLMRVRDPFVSSSLSR